MCGVCNIWKTVVDKCVGFDSQNGYKLYCLWSDELLITTTTTKNPNRSPFINFSDGEHWLLVLKIWNHTKYVWQSSIFGQSIVASYTFCLSLDYTACRWFTTRIARDNGWIFVRTISHYIEPSLRKLRVVQLIRKFHPFGSGGGRARF